MIARYLRMISQRFQGVWERWWFEPASRIVTARLRVLLALVAALWFASHLRQTTWYFGESGWLRNELVDQLISQTQEDWRSNFAWSPLWFFEGETAVVIYIYIGLLWSLVVGAGVGGRFAVAGLWLWIIGLCHRLAWAASTVEPVLAALLGYLIFEPGASMFTIRSTKNRPVSWQAAIVISATRAHCWLLIATGLASQLANPTWWQGDAVWWLAATGRSNLLATDWLRDNVLLMNGLTHLIVMVELAALILLIPMSTRPIGVMFGLLVGCSYALLADQFLYGVTLAISLTAFCDEKLVQVISQTNTTR